MLARSVEDKKEIFTIIVLLTAGPHACKQSFEECVYLPGSHSSSVCSKLQLSLIVRLFKALQMSKCVAPHRFCNTRSPKLTTNIQMSKCLSCPTNISVLKILSSSSSFLSSCRANTSIRNHHYCEFYQCDSQIVGVVSTLQDLSRDSHPFSHNHIPAPSVISHNHISW